MDEQLDYIELVKKAQLGDKQCLNRLAELARERLQLYVYRLTLKDDLTQEIVQESMLEMCKILGKLEKTDRFWPWLYGIAVNKIRRHRRIETTQRRLAMSQVRCGVSPSRREEGLENLVSQELKQIVSTAMQRLKTRHRAVLVMRCYDGMSYSEIAETMGCSEFSTRMLFLRAKRSLQKQLSRNGLGKGSLLAVLVLFGKMTAPTEAAAANVSITAATIKVGFLAGLAGLATSKTAILSLTAAGVVTAGSIVATSGPGKTMVQPRQQSVGRSNVVGPLGQVNSRNEEYWYFFPEGPGGPMMMRVKADVGGKQPYCRLLQNDRANYYYRDGTMYINNYRMYASDLGVLRIPTDSPELNEFLSRVQGHGTQMQHVQGKGKGLLVIATLNRESAEGGPKAESWAIRHYNVLDEDYFQSDWPARVGTVDSRDIMHKRGWTYLRVSGQIDGEQVSGSGRIPFVYAASRRYSPWLKLRRGDDLRIVDSPTEACVYGARGALVARYDGGSFFKGLARPWMGLHTIDTVRRDAAQQNIWFETKHARGADKAEVLVNCGQVNLVYTIDLEADLIDEIALWVGNDRRGQLSFSYLQSIDDVDEEFAEPRTTSYRRPRSQSEGLLWLANLVEGMTE
jgi:RNA polymerase sigma-70 factor (ECF subfamily)